MKNLEKFLSLLDDTTGLLLTSRYSRHYCAEFDIAEGVAVVTKKGSRYFTDFRYIESAQGGIQGMEVVMMDRDHPYSALINGICAEYGITRLGYEEEYMTVAERDGYAEKLQAELVPMNDRIHGFRQVKEEWELERMRKAQAITDKAFSEVLGRIKAGQTEKELQAELIYCLYKNGAEGLSFDPIVVSGPNTSLPHGVAGDRVIQSGDFITMDFGVILGGYCSDMTRTVAVGYATEEMEKVYNIVLAAQAAGIAATKAGATGAEIDGAARNLIAEAGYGSCFGHGYGHSLGLEVHESPNCGPRNQKPMAAGVVSSAEPGIYIPGKFGVRIEDVVIIRENGCEDITNSPKNLIIV